MASSQALAEAVGNVVKASADVIALFLHGYGFAGLGGQGVYVARWSGTQVAQVEMRSNHVPNPRRSGSLPGCRRSTTHARVGLCLELFSHIFHFTVGGLQQQSLEPSANLPGASFMVARQDRQRPVLRALTLFVTLCISSCADVL